MNTDKLQRLYTLHSANLYTDALFAFLDDVNRSSSKYTKNQIVYKIPSKVGSKGNNDYINLKLDSLKTLYGEEFLDDEIIRGILQVFNNYSYVQLKETSRHNKTWEVPYAYDPQFFAYFDYPFYTEWENISSVADVKKNIQDENSILRSIMYWGGRNTCPLLHRQLFITINIGGNHWVMVHINTEYKILTYYDSLYGNVKDQVNEIMNKIEKWLNLIQKFHGVIYRENLPINAPFQNETWMNAPWNRRIYPPFNLPRQNNLSDCGVYMLIYIITIMHDCHPSFNHLWYRDSLRKPVILMFFAAQYYTDNNGNYPWKGALKNFGLPYILKEL